MGPLCSSCNILRLYRENSNFRTIFLLRARLRKAFGHFSANGKAGNSSHYNIDYNAIFKYIGPCPKGDGKYHIDHVIPLSMFDFDNPLHIKAAFAPENHQWLKAEENLKKNNRCEYKKFLTYIKKFEV